MGMFLTFLDHLSRGQHVFKHARRGASSMDGSGNSGFDWRQTFWVLMRFGVPTSPCPHAPLHHFLLAFTARWNALPEKFGHLDEPRRRTGPGVRRDFENKQVSTMRYVSKCFYACHETRNPSLKHFFKARIAQPGFKKLHGIRYDWVESDLFWPKTDEEGSWSWSLAGPIWVEPDMELHMRVTAAAVAVS